MPKPKNDSELRAIYTKMSIEESNEQPILPALAKERKAIPVYSGFVKYFPRAICAISQHSLIGGIQHGQTAQSLRWDRSLSGDELDAMMRHIVEEDWVAVAWRAMANLEKHLEAREHKDFE